MEAVVLLLLLLVSAPARPEPADASEGQEGDMDEAFNFLSRFISTDTHGIGELDWEDKQAWGKHVDSTYGEWTMHGEKQWLQTLLTAHSQEFGSQFEKVDFWDFGSGRGLATLVPWFEFKFRNAYGVEAVNVRYRFACLVLESIQKASQSDQQLSKQLRGQQQRSVTFFLSDFASFPPLMKTLGNKPAVAWSSSLCFEKDTLKDLAHLVAHLPPNSLLGSSSALAKTDGFRFLGKGTGDMSWAKDNPFHLYRKMQPSFLQEEMDDDDAVRQMVEDAQVLERREDPPSPAMLKKEKCSLTVPTGDTPFKFEKGQLESAHRASWNPW